MLKIWGRRNGLNVQKLMWCVTELGLEYERIDHGGPFGGNDADWYLAMNPNGLVPTIEDDGFILSESNSIIRYLSEKHGRGGLWSEDIQARAITSKWMDWQLGTLIKSVMPIFYSLIRTAAEDRDQSALNEAIDLAAVQFKILDQQLSKTPFVAGESLSMGDIPVGVLTYRWFNLDIPRPEVPHVVDWYTRLQQRPAYCENVMLALT